MTDDTALWATDALLDRLAAGGLLEDDQADDRGLSLLAALVVDVITDLPTASPMPDDLRRRRSRLLRLAPRTGVAAVAVIAIVSTGGVAAASVNAGPTSALFPLHQVLTGQPQLDGSQRQALEVRDKLQSATKALAAGKVDRAQKDASAAGKRIAKVAESDGRRNLAAQWVMVTKQVAKARVVTPVVPVKPTQPVLPTPDHSTTPTAKPTLSKLPTPAPTPATHSPAVPAPVTITPVAPTSAAPTSPTPTPVVAPTTPQPSDSATVAPLPSDVAPSGSDSPDPSDSPTRGRHHGKGGKGSTPTQTPTAAPGSPVDPIVIIQTPTDTGSPSAPSTAPSDPPASAPAPSQAGSVPTSSDSPPASSTPSANPLA